MASYNKSFDKSFDIMTKEELKALVSKRIMGQGNQVDVGSTLPLVLNEIIDKLGDGEMSDYAQLVELDNFEEFASTTSYSAGDIVRLNGKLYEFKVNHSGTWDDEDVERTTVFDILYGKLPVSVAVTISALQSANLSAEQASAAGFDALAIEALQGADNPTIHFNDMCVTFNGVEVISDDLVNQSALIVHTAVGGGELYKAILSVYTDGRIVYTVTPIE